MPPLALAVGLTWLLIALPTPSILIAFAKISTSPEEPKPAVTALIFAPLKRLRVPAVILTFPPFPLASWST
ncbi:MULTISPECIES: hypothetical protein [Pseudanabaena]|uniref:hypothetical protein n=1 Tax=Pseudanabaena TaxID=1152 RepID=UPI00247A7206|nr:MULTISPECIES: hypothetical protein [Pseudanabaena]MEA5488376.1 hypothetical protein [Pseudanabaena sp. CCNP1317]WGS72801.1 hypothetical protein OA858_01865 [Pseudanabaena galeata CCNP1313]